MENRIPKYLLDIAELEKYKNNEFQVKIKCICGNKTFIILKHLKTEQDIELEKLLEKKSREYNEFYRNPNDKKGYWVKRNFFGKIVDKIDQSEMPMVSFVQIIKVKCAKCGKEHIIFDSRLYGYDGVMGENTSPDYNEIDFKQIKIKSSSDPVEISIRIINDLSYEEFIEQVGEDFNYEDYTNAFSAIDIFAKIDNKKIEIFSMETA